MWRFFLKKNCMCVIDVSWFVTYDSFLVCSEVKLVGGLGMCY